MARFRFILTSAFCLTTGAVAAQEALPAGNPGAPTDGYAGVCPNSANPPAVDVPAGQSPARITWPGFQTLPDQGTRIFVQATVPFQFSTETRGSSFVVSLGDVGIAGENNGRPLETRFFNTPVVRASLKRIKKQKETQLILELRGNATPRVHTETGTNGYFFLMIDFPPGQYIENAPAPAPVAAAPAPTAAPSRPADPMAAGGSLQGSARVNVQAPTLTTEQNAAINNERPPAVRATTGGSISFGGGTR